MIYPGKPPNQGKTIIILDLASQRRPNHIRMKNPQAF